MHKKILLTGGSGKLGKKIIESKKILSILAPSRKELDITKPETISEFFERNSFDTIIHCAAISSKEACEKEKIKAIDVNVIGTGYLVKEVINKELKENKKIRFIYISSDAVYSCEKGNYSEKDAAVPRNFYGFTKLGGECRVNILSNYCSIRTSFFLSEQIKFKESMTDVFSSKIPVDELIDAIAVLLNNNYVGTINVGGPRRSLYDIYKEFNPKIKPAKIKDVVDKNCKNLALDSSLDCKLWKKINNESLEES